MKWLALLFLIAHIALAGSAGVIIEWEGKFARLVNKTDHRVWCQLETEHGEYMSIWLDPGHASRWLNLGGVRFKWGCES